jgi:hypothetical protein
LILLISRRRMQRHSRTLKVEAGDRLLPHTEGLVKAENARARPSERCWASLLRLTRIFQASSMLSACLLTCLEAPRAEAANNFMHAYRSATMKPLLAALMLGFSS